MAQYRKDVYNLAPGLGMAVGDPREDEARAREASSRADQELALRRMQAAQSQALAQREMTLNESRSAFEQSLASQARGGSLAYGDGQAAAPAGRASGPNVPMGRDAMARSAYAAKAMQDILGGGQEARGAAYNARQAPFAQGGGVRAMDPVPSRTPAVGLTARQASFDPNGTGMIGDLGNLDFQQAVQSLLGEKAKMGLARDEFKSQDTARRAATDLGQQTFKENVNHNRQQEALQRLGILSQQAQLEQATNAQLSQHMEDLGSQASAFLDQNAPNRLSGDVPQSLRMDLQSMASSHPELARAIFDKLNTESQRSRVAEGANSFFRPSRENADTALNVVSLGNVGYVNDLLNYFGNYGVDSPTKWLEDGLGITLTDDKARKAKLVDYYRTLGSVLNPDGTKPSIPSSPNGTAAQQALREALARFGSGR